MYEKSFNSVLAVEHGENYLKKELYQLIKNEEFIFDFIQKSALDGLWFWDLDNPENEWMNPKFWITLGYDPETMPHKSSTWQSIINKADLELALDNFNKHCENPLHPYDQVVRYQHKLGHTVWIHCKGIIIRDDKGKPIRMLGAHTDVTKLKKTELKLRKQVERYHHIIDGTNIGTWEWNVQTGQTIFNEKWAGIFGYTLLELDPISINTWTNSVHPDDLIKSKKALNEHFNGKTDFYEYEVRVKHKTGDWIWVRDRGKVVSKVLNDKPEWMIGSRQEITQRKKDLVRHKLFIKQAPSAMAMLDANMCYIAHSKKWKIDYKISIDDIIGKSHYEVFPEIGDEWKKDHQDCLSGQILRNEEDKFVRADGSIQWLSWELHPWYEENNKVGGVIMLTTDITKAKETEIQLKLSEKKFRGNFENAATGMGILDLNGKWLDVNTTLCNMIGYTAEELKQLTFQNITHPDDLKTDLDLVEDLIAGTISFCNIEKRYVHKNGTSIHAVLSVSILRDEDNIPLNFIAQITDITPRVIARKKLEEALAKLEGILEASTQVGIIGTDTKGLITTFNKGAEELLGYERAEMINKMSLETLHLKEEFKAYTAELSSQIRKDVSGFAVFSLPLRNQSYITKEWTYVRKDETQFPVQLTTTTIKTEGEISGYLSVITNISEIKKVEKEIKSLLEVANDQNDRLKNFAHIVSHNLKSHSGNFNMLLDLYLQENPDLKENEIIQLFKLASSNLTDTIKHLNEVVLMNSSLENNMVSLNLHNAINKVILNTQLSAKKAQVKIVNAVDPKVKVLAISAYLDSIILNFITNGIKYRSNQNNSYVILNAFKEEDFVVLSVEDNGLGIDLDKHHSKLFGMYKTFHKNEEARGIGLFITKNQVEAISGKIEVESEVNKGTTFKIYMKYEKN